MHFRTREIKALKKKKEAIVFLHDAMLCQGLYDSKNHKCIPKKSVSILFMQPIPKKLGRCVEARI